MAVVDVVDDERCDTVATGAGELEVLLPARALAAVDAVERSAQAPVVADPAAEGQASPRLLHPLVVQALEAVPASAGRVAPGEPLVDALVGLLPGEDREREARLLSEPVLGEGGGEEAGERPPLRVGEVQELPAVDRLRGQRLPLERLDGEEEVGVFPEAEPARVVVGRRQVAGAADDLAVEELTDRAVLDVPVVGVLGGDRGGEGEQAGESCGGGQTAKPVGRGHVQPPERTRPRRLARTHHRPLHDALPLLAPLDHVVRHDPPPREGGRRASSPSTDQRLRRDLRIEASSSTT